MREGTGSHRAFVFSHETFANTRSTTRIPTMAEASAPDTIQVTFDLDRKTFDDFKDARDQWEASLGIAPDVGWLLAFALQTTDPIQTVEIADEMAFDYLRNRISLP